MKNYLVLVALMLVVSAAHAQPVADRIAAAFNRFENDEQLKYGIASLMVVDASNGKTIFAKNNRIGLAPASTQKIITSAAAYELLDRDHAFRTELGIASNGTSKVLVIKASGDPTLGSWRWKHTSEDVVLERMVKAIVATGEKHFEKISVIDEGWKAETIPSGWIWEDIGNYYGAGAEALIWRENQFDLVLQSGNKIGDAVTIRTTKPQLYNYTLISGASSAAKGTGDNAYIYFPVGRKEAVVRGTIPIGENNFVISGAMPSGRIQFLHTLKQALAKKDITINTVDESALMQPYTTIHTETSPPLDSISYWFLKKSVNLYGEAMVKTFAITADKEATTSNGVKIVKDLWTSKTATGAGELNMFDGSGLSPLNRVTTQAQVNILLFAKKQDWFSSFISGFPEYNGMKMKSGTINGVKGFCGYHQAGGKQYVFSFLVNNYNGGASMLVQKMYRVLDVLK